ncbi:hypothetical protein CHU98_g11718 [Xylaria longipes]|nr:hypothetical protein CHU98_g11718 [Xylaria longipes]
MRNSVADIIKHAVLSAEDPGGSTVPLEMTVTIPAISHVRVRLCHDDLPTDLVLLYQRYAKDAASALDMAPRVLRLLGNELDKVKSISNSTTRTLPPGSLADN